MKAVKDLERIIKEIKEGKFNIESVGTRNVIKVTNVTTESGSVENRVLIFELEHTVNPDE